MANRKNMNTTLRVNQITPGTQVNGGTANGACHPPRNRMVAMAHMVMIAMYSPRKKRRNAVEEYSTAKPATSSDSASTRSNGGRLVSASADTKKITNIGRSGSQNQLRTLSHGTPRKLASPFSWASTMADRLSEPAHKST